jgi:hypothetical protein
MHYRFSPWNACGLALLLSACSSYAPPGDLAGMSREALVAKMGQPDRERPLDSGSRLEFPRGPFGTQTWFVYLDNSGRASRAEQVLTEPNFQRVDVGMTQEEVRQLLGRPSDVQLLGRNRGVIWSYRYAKPCTWFQVELSPQQVRSAGYGELPECDKRADRSDG